MPGDTFDTIVAPITPPGIGGVSLLRISGARAFEIASRRIMGLDVAAMPGNTIEWGRVTREDGSIVDEILVSAFRAPRSYTGEDVIEIGCHGNPVIVDEILEILLKSGTRLSEPGEFTKRAFLNGRIDLNQAEAVEDVIVASSRSAADMAQRQLHGELGLRIKSAVDSLVGICGLVELELDFVEEGIKIADRLTVKSRLVEILDSIRSLASTYRQGKLIKSGISIAIAGPPNAGKSSILNRIVGESRAIVSPIPGTTRDEISATIEYSGLRLEFWDTAGMRDDAQGIEQLGIEKAYDRLKKVDAVINVADGSKEESAEFLEIALNSSHSNGTFHVVVANKCDLGVSNGVSDVISRNDSIQRVSAKSGEGFPQLIDRVLDGLLADRDFGCKDSYVSNRRQFECISRATESIEEAVRLVDTDAGDLLSLEIRASIDSLSEIIGRVTSEDILNSIFQNFCIGK